MNRRTFLGTAAASALLPSLGLAAGFTNYKPGSVDAALAQGKTVLVDYSAVWCSTCKRQERVINALRDANPAYDGAITFIKVDWDAFKDDIITTRYNIPRRSTLILLRGDAELGRIVAGTAQGEIKALLDLAL